MNKKGIILLGSILTIMICLCFNAGAISTSGYCGENVRYIYDANNGSVVLKGDGDMFDYQDASDSPFCGESIVSVVIDKNITSIGMNAFFGCEYLESVIIPESVCFVGASAFESCSSLKELVLPEALTDIGKKAFRGCESLTCIVLPTGITDLPEYAFEWCTDLASVVFLGNIEIIDVNAFRNCKAISKIHFGTETDYIDKSVIGNLPADAIIHGADYRETVKDCLIGETITSLYCDSCNENIYSKEFTKQYDSHDFGEYFSDKNHTCTLDGTKTATCKRCGMKDTVVDPGSSQGHSWNEWVENTAASCTTEGEKIRRCLTCQVTETETIPAILHKNSYTVNGSLPSCTENGYSQGEFCPDCKNWISGHILLPFSGHIGGVATCNKKAVCSVCEEEYGNTDDSNHTNTVVIDGKAATCTEKGYTESRMCNDCNKIIAEKKDIEASGHKKETVTAVGATCTKEGLSEYEECSVCGEITKEPFVIPAKGHNEKVVPGADATCTAAGFTDKIICTLCDEVITDAENIPAKEHSEVKIPSKAATCTEKGLTEGKKCSVCKMITVPQRETPVKPHDYRVSVEKKATFTSNGKTLMICFCGAVRKNSVKTVYSPKSCTLSKTSYTYDSKVKTPDITVKDSAGNVLKNGVDYDVKYESGRKTTGKYTVTVTFKDKYSGTKKLYFKIAPKSTNKISASQTASSITLSWNMVTGADGYRVYKYDSKNKKYVKVKDVTVRSLKITDLNSGSKYKFKIKAYKKDGGTIWGNASEAYSFSTKPAAPGKISFEKTSSSVTLKWKKVTGASGYAIYRYSSGAWRRIATVNSGSRVTCKIDGLKSGTKYKFHIKAFRKSSGSTLWSSASDSVTVFTNPGIPALKVSSDKKGVVILKWSNVSGESGYRIYYSTKKDGKLKKLADNKADVTKLTESNLTSGKTYYFKVRSYRKTSGGTLYSAWSPVCNIKVK